MAYVELHACSAFSFLRGGSFPEQLAETAAGLELPAMALLDRNGVYGAQRFSVAAREHNVRPIVGAELTMEDNSILPVLVKDRGGYKNLCELLTQAHLRSAEIQGNVIRRKGPYRASGNWWDENAWARSEWDLEMENGALCQCHHDGEQWRLDGVYD